MTIPSVGETVGEDVGWIEIEGAIEGERVGMEDLDGFKVGSDEGWAEAHSGYITSTENLDQGNPENV